MINKSRHPISTVWLLIALTAALLAGCNDIQNEDPTATFPAELPTAVTSITTPTLAATGAAETAVSTVAASTALPPATAISPTAPAAIAVTEAATTATTPPAPLATALPTNTPPTPLYDFSYEQLDSPGDLLASFYNAINLEQFERAYGYLGENPTIPFDQFAEDYAGVFRVVPVIIPPAVLEGAAGSVYAQVPTFVHITYPDNRRESRQGCIVTRAALQESGTAAWQIYEMDLSPAPALTLDLPQLAQACPLPVIDTSRPSYDRQFTPIDVLSSLYDAVNRQEYGRAYAYWRSLTPTLEEFAQGYADTNQVIMAVIPPDRIGAAAGQMGAQIPTFLVAIHHDDTVHPFQGCYTTLRTNPGIDPGSVWWIYSGDIQPAASPNAFDIHALDDTCIASHL